MLTAIAQTESCIIYNYAEGRLNYNTDKKHILVIFCLIIGVSYTAEVNLILKKYILSGIMKSVLVIICLIIGVSYSSKVN